MRLNVNSVTWKGGKPALWAVRVLEFSAAVTAHNVVGGNNSVNARFEAIANQEVSVECREKLEAVFSALDQRDQEAVCALEALKARLTG